MKKMKALMPELANPFELEPSWKKILAEELLKPYMTELACFLAEERFKNKIYPPEKLVLHAFWKTPFPEVKVVIVGQDPYHRQAQAHGLCFSVPHGVAPPPSLLNIFKELQTDLNIVPATHGCLLNWAEQGVFLLNTTLTVREGEPLSHHNRGWEKFTDAVIEKLAESQDPKVFILWGNAAEKKCAGPLKKMHASHLVLKAPHPSPLSAYQGFFGSRPFSQTNAFLVAHGKAPINWSLSEKG